MDHDLSPPWILLNMVKALKFGLFIMPPEQRTLERNQSWIPEAPAGEQAVFIPTACDDNCLVPAIIEDHKLYFNLHVISLMIMWDPENHTTWDVHQTV